MRLNRIVAREYAAGRRRPARKLICDPFVLLWE
jgi:hypothetical protein